MGRRTDTKAKVEFGDFQTPPDLAAEVCRRIARLDTRPRAIVEPTCGVGSLLLAAVNAFPEFEVAAGFDVSAEYIRHAADALQGHPARPRVTLEEVNFFEADWSQRIARLPDPILLVGNPPWVTNSDLGYLNSHNIPEKANFHGRTGLDAVTGKSNFDISEWMLIKLLSWLDGRDAVVAMLCKSAVARKVLAFGWNAGLRIDRASMCRIDAAKHFGASVDACLLVCYLGRTAGDRTCRIFDGLEAERTSGAIGYRDGSVIADVGLYDRWQHLLGECQYKWRSGVKHDCSGVMELRRTGNYFENADGEVVELEPTLLYPMLKSSDVARGGPIRPSRYMLVTQRAIGADTSGIAEAAPMTWRYLNQHRARFERRASSIYRGKPPFSIFGVGEYTFAPWKVAISGLYKKLEFQVIGPHEGVPVVVDDTCYFLACSSEAEARLLHELLSSEPATEFYSAFVFWDAKRPITTDLLRRLDLWKLAQVVGRAEEFQRVGVDRRSGSIAPTTGEQLAFGLG